MNMKFFFCNYTVPRKAEAIAADVRAVIAATKHYDHSETMMFFALMPATAFEGVMAGVDQDRHFVKIAAQNVSLGDEAEVDGELSLELLKTVGVDMIRVGALERRLILGESDAVAARKNRTVLGQGFKSLFCVGETAAQRGEGAADEVLAAQILPAYDHIPDSTIYRTALLYQPAWSREREADAEDIAYLAQRVGTIRRLLDEAKPGLPEPLPVIYGGRIAPDDAVALLREDLIDGVMADDALWDMDTLIGVIRRTLM
jgi:triosephosphate isomerase